MEKRLKDFLDELDRKLYDNWPGVDIPTPEPMFTPEEENEIRIARRERLKNYLPEEDK